MRKYHITGYPQGLTAGSALVVVAKSGTDAREKAALVLRARGCDLPAEALSASEDKPRMLERYP